MWSVCGWHKSCQSPLHAYTRTHKHTDTRVRTLLKCVWPEDQGSPCQRGGINGFICVCECVCVGMFMLLSANSSSAACPAPCKDQTPCLLEERQKPEWLCFLYSAIKKWHERLADRHPRKRLWPLYGLLAPARWLLHQKQTNKKMLASVPLNERKWSRVFWEEWNVMWGAASDKCCLFDESAVNQRNKPQSWRGRRARCTQPRAAKKPSGVTSSLRWPHKSGGGWCGLQ